MMGDECDQRAIDRTVRQVAALRDVERAARRVLGAAVLVVRGGGVIGAPMARSYVVDWADMATLEEALWLVDQAREGNDDAG